jgi:glycosyltransferase involved in cell wall biosynthesis
MKHINKEGMITQIIYNECNGNHIYCDLYSDDIPKADIYVLHCFKNPKHLKAFRSFKADGKIISLIHSSFPCLPSIHSDIVVTITNTWKKELKNKYGIDSVMIYGGIETEKYKYANIDYTGKTFGKISRPERGKYHEEWNYMVLRLLNENESYKCRIISNKYYKLPVIEHLHMTYIEGVTIGDTQNKIKELQNITVYADAHSEINPFIDTFNMSMLESMTCGMPIIILGNHQEAMVEVLGGVGIVCYSIEEFEDKLKQLLQDDDLKKELGEKAKERSLFFDKSYMVDDWNKLLEGLC